MVIAVLGWRELRYLALSVFFGRGPVAKVLLIDVKYGQVLLCLHGIEALEHRDDLVASTK